MVRIHFIHVSFLNTSELHESKITGIIVFEQRKIMLKYIPSKYQI